MNSGFPWAVLGIPPGSDRATIRRAYAARLKATNPEDDPDGFKTLRLAYETAIARRGVDDGGANVRRHGDLRGGRVERGSQAAPPRIQAVDATDGALTALEQAKAALAKHIGGPRNVEVEAAQEELNTILLNPALDNVSMYLETENWVAHVLAQNIPRSDSLLELASSHFKWGSRNPDSGAVRLITTRCADLKFLASLRNRSNRDHAVFASLTRPISRWQRIRIVLKPDIVGDTRSFLASIETDHPTIHGDLQQDTLGWWSKYLAKPHIPAWMYWTGFMVLIWAVPIALTGGPTDGTLPRQYYLAAAASVLFALVFIYWELRFRTSWSRISITKRKLWIEFGWIPIAFTSFVLVAILPDGVLSDLAVGLLAVISGGWAFVTGSLDRRLPSPGWQIRALRAPVYLGVFVYLIQNDLSSGALRRLLLASAGAAVSFTWGVAPMMTLWGFRLDRSYRWWVMAALFVVATAPALLLVISPIQPQLFPLVAAAAVLAALATMAPAATFGGRVGGLRALAMIIGVYVLWAMTFSDLERGVMLRWSAAWVVFNSYTALIGLALTHLGVLGRPPVRRRWP